MVKFSRCFRMCFIFCAAFVMSFANVFAEYATVSIELLDYEGEGKFYYGTYRLDYDKEQNTNIKFCPDGTFTYVPKYVPNTLTNKKLFFAHKSKKVYQTAVCTSKLSGCEDSLAVAIWEFTDSGKYDSQKHSCLMLSPSDEAKKYNVSLLRDGNTEIIGSFDYKSRKFYTEEKKKEKKKKLICSFCVEDNSNPENEINTIIVSLFLAYQNYLEKVELLDPGDYARFLNG